MGKGEREEEEAKGRGMEWAVSRSASPDDVLPFFCADPLLSSLFPRSLWHIFPLLLPYRNPFSLQSSPFINLNFNTCPSDSAQ